MKSPEIIPSVLGADFAHLAADVEEALAAGVRTVQVDVMDGMFVPNITVGVPVVRDLAAATDARLDVHLMVESPGRYLEDFAAAGAHVLTVHVESTRHLHRAITHIRALGPAAGVALNPATPLSAVEDVLELCDVVLLMTVNPGFGGQAFIPQVLPKVERLRATLDTRGLDARIQVDGGIDRETVTAAVTAGAEQLVAGSAVFGSPDGVAAAVAALRDAAAEAFAART